MNSQLTEFQLSAEELEKAKSFQKKCEEEFEASHANDEYKNFYLDINTTTRFLYNLDFNETKALKIWNDFIEIRKRHNVDGMTEESVKNELSNNVAFVHGHNKNNSACITVLLRNHLPDEVDFDEFMRFCFYMCEKAEKEAEKIGSKRFCVIVWRLGFTMKNSNGQFRKRIRDLAPIWQGYYQHKLDTVYITHVNMFFKIAFAVIKVALSGKIVKKLKIINDEKELLEYFDPENLVAEMGGTSKYDYKNALTRDDWSKYHTEKDKNEAEEVKKDLSETENTTSGITEVD